MYNKEFKGDVCSHSHSFFLDNFIRRILQNPKKIVGEYIRQGDTVIDLGCGPGFFSIDMAKMVGDTGKVYSVDLQKEMLDDVKIKAAKQNLSKQIVVHNCGQDKIGLNEEVQADFILAFYMIHETPDPIAFAKQVKQLLKKGGKFLIVEPLFHVSKKKFLTICEDFKSIGFSVLDTPKKKGGRSLLLTI
ncbi:MAG: class I SAM-dependent methyltransferase [Deltaproteobacteria bacterium]|uniref:class I SAM-dependent methyltransferase n=1 Tax=Desulfobacula sp. TaxID=2593537 RepID=UPI0019B8B092|nr:class I SAM-dependent methyltransferase [Candidatus Desulfobacula maris]MBL6992481.1 class I SAM-dependent methyltransferase [Desulfobacula sp.]